MQNTATPVPPAPAPAPARPRHANLQTVPAWLPHECQCDLDHGADAQFVAMLDAYRESGGLCRARELQEVMARSTGVGGPEAAALDGWIMQREVICFDWQASAWLPWFQFNRPGMAPHPQLRPVLQELNAVYDRWEIGCWFARPNPWLAGRMPVDALLAQLPEVLQAARAERFIAH